MNAIVTQSMGNDGSKRVPDTGKAYVYGLAGIVVQVLMMYIIMRDLLMTTPYLNYYVPISGSVQARMAVALLIGWIALSTRGLGPGFGAFRNWGWIILGSFGLMFLVEGMVTITAGTNSKPMVVGGINLAIFLFSVGSAYLFALRGRTPTHALKFLLQPYIYLTIIVAVLGLTAWLLVHAFGVNPADWYLPERFSAGRVSDSPLVAYYSSPFNLSGILNQSNGQLLNFSFNRATGLFEEPAVAAFFVAPAIFLTPLLFEKRSSRWWLRLWILVLVGFLLIVNSKTNFLVMSITGSVMLLRIIFFHPRVRSRFLAAVALVLLSVFAWSIFIGDSGVGSEFRSVRAAYVDDLTSSLQRGTFLGPGVFEPARATNNDEPTPRGLLSWFAVLLHVAILGGLGMRVVLSHRQDWYFAGALIYLAGHSMKSFGHTASTGYYLYMIVVLSLTLACYWSIRRPENTTEPQGTGEQRPEDPRGKIRMVFPR